MAKSNRLKEVEAVRGDLHAVIPALVNAGGQAAAAQALNVSQATISLWLKHNGYRAITQYVRSQEKAS